MFDYNDRNIFSGYIKQLLSSFNLPTIRVVKDNIILQKGMCYIYKKDVIKMLNNINLATTSLTGSDYEIVTDYKWNKHIVVSNLEYNAKSLNLTKTANINNLYYDTYTHEYLGSYLRFLKDYRHLNLMSLYNCFSNELVDDLNLTITLSNTKKYYLASETGYKIYKVPVRFFEDYTIAIESSLPIEMACGFYNKTQDSSSLTSNIATATWQKFNSCSFSRPILYTKLDAKSLANQSAYFMSENNTGTFTDKEKELYLFIKMPFSNKSSIVILEGDFRNYNDYIIKGVGKDSRVEHNRSIINNDLSIIDQSTPKLISSLQLLAMNSSVSHPFADRLIEYLTGNTIDCCDSIADNIKRTQVEIYNAHNKLSGYSYASEYGVWQTKYQAMLYSIAAKNGLIDSAYDILGYVDKDLEQKLGDVDIYDTPIASTNISGTKVNRSSK
jgi:hypothetical protein